MTGFYMDKRELKYFVITSCRYALNKDDGVAVLGFITQAEETIPRIYDKNLKKHIVELLISDIEEGLNWCNCKNEAQWLDFLKFLKGVRK